MLNKEKYAKEIVEISVNNGTIALKDNKPISCRKIHCNDCGKHVPGYGCSMKKLTEWANSEYKEPILTKEEKAYLSAVIKPFRNEVLDIQKKSRYCEWILIIMKDHERICLPFFEKGTIYKGMEENRRYTPEELGL